MIKQIHPREHERGQIVVIVAVALVAIVGMVGLVIDGGSAYAQRRAEQNASDLAALAGANTYLLTNDEAKSRAAALAVTAENGFEHGADGAVVDVSFDLANGVEVTVQINAPHENTFSKIMGFNSFDVATTATALAGIPDTAEGAAPFTFNVDIFGSNGLPLAQYGNPDTPFAFGDTNNHAPTGPSDFAWTNYGTGNVNTSDVRNIIDGDLVITKTIDFGEYIGQHNNGNHTALFTEVNSHLSGKDVPVPIVDLNGNFQGWATFHVVSASGGSTKKINGYFVSSFVNQRLTVTGCTLADCPVFFGTPVLKLVD